MKVLIFIFLLFCIGSKVEVQSKVINEKLGSEPRIFFKQMVEASGLFPIEINVPDTIGSMWNGMSSMYQAASSYFQGGSESEGNEGQGQQQQVSNDEVVSKNAKSKHRKKKVKKVQKKKISRSEMNMLDIFNFLMF